MVIKATKVRNLYRLEGSIDVSNVVVLSKETDESTHLWHQQLGHTSEKGIKVLVICKVLPNLKSLNFNFCKHCVFGN